MTTFIINQKTGDTFSLTTPLLDPERMDNENLEDLDDEFFNLTTGAITPSNVYESDDQYELRLLAPGLEKGNIIIDVDDNDVLTVSAEADDEDPEESNNYRRREFIIKGFNRSFQLPEEADAEEIIADYKNGIVKLLIPKREGGTQQIIEIIED